MPLQDDTLINTAGRRHPVPQNVMDVEFKVVGNLTVRQLIYAFAGLTLAYIFYKSGLPSFWRTIFVSIITILTILVAFVPVQERGMDKWIIIFIKSMFSPTQMIWRKSYATPAYFLSDYAQIIRNEIITLTPAKSRNQLDEYLGQLPENLNDLDQKELDSLKSLSSTIDKISIQQNASSVSQMAEPTTPTLSETSTVTTIEPKETVEAPKQSRLKEIHEEELASKMEFVDAHFEKSQQKPKVEIKLLEDEEKLPMPMPIPKPIQTKPKIKLENQPFKPVVQQMAQINRPIVMPKDIRGEIKIKTTSKLPSIIVTQNIGDLANQERELEKRIGELLDITKKAKTYYKKSDTPKVSSHEEKRIEFFKSKYDELQTEREKISTKLDRNTSKISSLTNKEDREPLEKQISELIQRNKQLSDQLNEIQNEFEKLKNAPEPVAQTKQEPVQATPATAPITQQYVANKNDDSLLMSIGKTPNIIYGVVKDKKAQLIEEAVVIIKDAEGDVIRALKTNKLGQFRTQAEVHNGKYTVEAVKGGEKFDIISVEAKGKVLDPVYLVGKE